MKENMRLFIIDDDDDDKKLFIESVKEIDDSIVCSTACDGLEALKILSDAENPLPDFIFLDLRMPRISGKQCLLEIRQIEKLRNVPVFIYTTTTDVNDSIALKSMGAVHFISKPTDPTELYYILSEVLSAKWD
ncbi:MAG: response regulator [Chitinophagaceae bacterium]|nr:response regulator [Chitinophagaceae bacterium]MBL0336710.1 response regulator [Chitinophagaceae bacterium]